jgi:quinol monooxygenase YgiN
MPAPETVVAVAHWQTTEAALDRVLAGIAEVTPLSRAEPGCLGYEAFQSVTDPTEIVLIEHYRDEAAFQAHLASPHYQEVVAGRIRPLLTDRRVEFLQPRESS